MVFAVGGVSSVIGATLATPISRRIGVGPTIIFSFLVFSVAVLFIPLARGPLIVALTLLAAHQLLGDGFAAIYDINEISLRGCLQSLRHVLGLYEKEAIPQRFD